MPLHPRRSLKGGPRLSHLRPLLTRWYRSSMVVGGSSSTRYRLSLGGGGIVCEQGGLQPLPPLSVLPAAEAVSNRNTQGCARASATSNCDTEHALACLRLAPRASSSPKVTPRF